MSSIRWLAQSTIYRDTVDLLGVQDFGDGRRAYALPVAFTMKHREPGYAVEAPTLELSPSSAQSLLQALWDAGLRPNDGGGSEAEAAALRAHVKFAEEVSRALLRAIPSGEPVETNTHQRG